jgi:cardiolipin synthase (CMP-forming)
MGINLATKITLLRILLTPIFLILLIRDEMAWAMAIFALAALTDALDGFIARTWHQKTAVGSVLDPLADKLLLTTAFVGLAVKYKHLIVFIIPIVSRDLILCVGTLLIFISGAKFEIRPNMSGKITTFCQILMVFFSLVADGLDKQYILHNNYYLGWVILTVFMTMLSGLSYVLKGIQWLHEQTTKPS